MKVLLDIFGRRVTSRRPSLNNVRQLSPQPYATGPKLGPFGKQS